MQNTAQRLNKGKRPRACDRDTQGKKGQMEKDKKKGERQNMPTNNFGKWRSVKLCKHKQIND